MRELQYGVEGKAANLRTYAVDDAGHGGACHEYVIKGPIGEPGKTGGPIANICFQNGPINVDGNGVNGIQHEDLLAIIIDRLEGFQRGPYKCKENSQSLYHCRMALKEMNDRTLKRIARNVEGTHTV